jgi:hypothetical protein
MSQSRHGPRLTRIGVGLLGPESVSDSLAHRSARIRARSAGPGNRGSWLCGPYTAQPRSKETERGGFPRCRSELVCSLAGATAPG